MADIDTYIARIQDHVEITIDEYVELIQDQAKFVYLRRALLNGARLSYNGKYLVFDDERVSNMLQTLVPEWMVSKMDELKEADNGIDNN